MFQTVRYLKARFRLPDDCTARVVWFYETRLAPPRPLSCARPRSIGLWYGYPSKYLWLLTGAALRKFYHLVSKLIIVELRRLECVRRIAVDLQWFSVLPYAPISSLRFRA